MKEKEEEDEEKDNQEICIQTKEKDGKQQINWKG